MAIALISGVTGQDGAYLSKFLLEKGYQVHGLVCKGRSSSLKNLEFLKIRSSIKFHECDLLDEQSIRSLIEAICCDEIYNLAAQSSVGESFLRPMETLKFNTISTLNFLESIRKMKGVTGDRLRFYQASSSEMYGSVDKLPITEKSVIHPLSPYGVSKASAHWMTVNYRESYDLFTCSGILFNHESFLRPESFFVKKVIRDCIRISRGLSENLRVGNIDVKRDFGYGPKYIEAMWLILQQKLPSDYLVCSGRSVSLREIVMWLFKRFGIDESKLVIDETFFRPNELKEIYGDNSKARELLGWDYNLDFFEVLENLVNEELDNFK